MQSVTAILTALDTRIVNATLGALLTAGEEIKERGLDVVDEWKHKVEFNQQTTIAKEYMEVLVTPTGRNKAIWKYIDLGTGLYGKKRAMYTIVPKDPAKLLRFQTGYSARTLPIARANVGTGQSFGPLVSAKQVLHPGIKGRKFSETFATQIAPPLNDRVTQAIKEVV